MRTRDPEKQQRIKDATVRLILREGIDGVSVSKIAREAGVSPATIYVYYDSKEEMLAEVFREYAHRPYGYLMRRLRPGMDAGELIETIVRGFFSFSREHEEIFSFVEQCSRCPSLSSNAADEDCSCDLFDLIHAYQANGTLRPYSDRAIGAVLFAPVRLLAMDRSGPEEESLGELVEMLRRLLLF